MDFENNKIIFIGTLIFVLAVNVYMYLQERDCKFKLKKTQQKVKKLKRKLGVDDKKIVTFADDFYSPQQQTTVQPLNNPMEYNTIPSTL